MGEVSDAVKGSGASRKRPPRAAGKDVQSLVEDTRATADELQELLMKKEEDLLNEGDDKKLENAKKVIQLRIAHMHCVGLKAALEDY